MEQKFEDFYYLIHDKSNTDTLDKQSVKKRGEQYKKEKKANNLASPKNGFVPGGDASHADVPFQPPPELGPAVPPQTKISSQPVALEETPIWRNEQRGFFNLCLGSFQLHQPFSSSDKLLLIGFDQGLCPGNGSSSSGNNLLSDGEYTSDLYLELCQDEGI